MTSLEATPGDEAVLAQALEIWNETAKGAMRCTSSLVKPPNRRPRLRKIVLGEMKGDLAAWRAYCEAFRGTGWCCGDNDRGWKASIDYVIRVDVYARYLDGEFNPVEARETKQKSTQRKTKCDIATEIVMDWAEEADRRDGRGQYDDDQDAGGAVIEHDAAEGRFYDAGYDPDFGPSALAAAGHGY